MVIIETRPDHFIMLFYDKAEFQTELIKLLLEDDNHRDIRFAGLVEDFSAITNNKKRLFCSDVNKIKTPNINTTWNNLMEANSNPIYIIRYLVVQTDAEVRAYHRNKSREFRERQKQKKMGFQN